MGTQFSDLLQNVSNAVQSACPQKGLGMIEDLISQFNKLESNSKLHQYISRQNVFDMLGKSRDEMTHSKIVAEILGGRYFSASGESSVMHFLDLIVRRAASQGIEFPADIRKTVLCRSLSIDSVEDKRYEYPVKSYLRDYQKKDSESLGRLDVYLRYSLNEPIKKNGRQTLEFFIENKILSREHDDQTQDYYDNCSNAKHALQFFVYLTADKVTDESFAAPAAKDRKGKPVFINISYQDLLDEVISPVLAQDGLAENDRFILQEYVNCLELPAFDDALKNTKAKAQFSIMATGSAERKMLQEFLSYPANSKLMRSCINAELGREFFRYSTQNALTFKDALEDSIRHSLRYEGVYSTLGKYYPIIGKQNNGTPFLIYGDLLEDGRIEYVDYDLWEYDGNPYASLSDALLAASKDYIERFPEKNIVKEFDCIYGKQKNGCPVFARATDKIFIKRPDLIEEMGRYYKPTPFNGLLIRVRIDADKIDKINEILGDGYSIAPVTPECFGRMLSDVEPQFKLHCSSKDYINIAGTKLFWRKGCDKYVGEICKAANIFCDDDIDEYDKELLLEFYKNHLPMILSLLRIIIEEETDENTRDSLLSDFRTLSNVNACEWERR